MGIVSRSRCENVTSEGVGGRRLGNDAERGVVSRSRCEDVVFEGVSSPSPFASPFNNNGGSSRPRTVEDEDDEDVSDDDNDDSLSDGAALKLLPLAGATLLTTLGPNTLGFLSSFTPAPIPSPTALPFPVPTLPNETVDDPASSTDPSSGALSVSSELLLDSAAPTYTTPGCTTLS